MNNIRSQKGLDMQVEMRHEKCKNPLFFEQFEHLSNLLDALESELLQRFQFIICN
jgi:hypothetical protein